MKGSVVKYYCVPGLTEGSRQWSLTKLRNPSPGISSLKTETCFNVGLTEGCQSLDGDQEKLLLWVLDSPFSENCVSTQSVLGDYFQGHEQQGLFICFEIGPRLNFSTAWSTNAVSICHAIGLYCVERIEQSVRYVVELDETASSQADRDVFAAALHDKMTQCVYNKPLDSFSVSVDTQQPQDEEWFEVDVLCEGRKALEKVNKDLGLALDDWDLDYYTRFFRKKLNRNPTSVECFDLAQSNSEHCRHWFFRGKMVVDGEEVQESLMDLVKSTQKFSNDNSIITLSDNSSAIEGFTVPVLIPSSSCNASKVNIEESQRHIIFTAETHNFPTGVAPFPGATTGTGGRIRDVQATGTGSNVVAGTAGYCFGNLNIPGYNLPWEDKTVEYPSNFALPCEIAVEASNGASDYGNKFGEPVLTGFARSFGMILQGKERREWIKPIMFSGGIGSIDGRHVSKMPPEKGMEVVKLGGPVYRIGVGGGSASSIQVQGDNASELDFCAVQRGDAEMEQKLNRAIRACVEMKENNPICSIHDQGAGGNGNVLKELVEPAGAVIYTEKFKLGDPTISTLELWGAEYQESNALLVKPENRGILEKICEREKVDVCFVGTVTGDGRIVVKEGKCDELQTNGVGETCAKKQKKRNPVDLELDVVLGKMPRKEFVMSRVKTTLYPLKLDPNLTVREALERVLRLPSVASKRYLTNKVDRSVTGLIAQQQCVGPLHTPVADVAVTSLSYFDTHGAATAIGEQPIKMLVDPCAGARMSLAEALTNLVFARISDIKDVKCSANWMWPAKLPGEGAALVDACRSVCTAMADLGVAIDGGKDSLSMAARVNNETVKAPGSLVISAYAPCPDVTATVTPDLKYGNGGATILHVRLNDKHQRLGGSALAQVFNQVGDESPDLGQPKMLSKCFAVTQDLLSKRLIASGHDVSDGGLITAVLEMAFTGNCGVTLNFDYSSQSLGTNPSQPHLMGYLSVMFAEELGIVLEVANDGVDTVCARYNEAGLVCQKIGHTGPPGEPGVVSVTINGDVILEDKITVLRDVWEATSFELEKLQANPRCVTEEQANLCHRQVPHYSLTFTPTKSSPRSAESGDAPKVAVIREEGSNGDREMIASFIMAGFEAWDVNMHDISTGRVRLDQFRGIIFVGGFSFADVLGSAKGWAAVSLFNKECRKQFCAFLEREDTFSLGVCNGCQLMALLGWVGKDLSLMVDDDDKVVNNQQGVCFTHNSSNRFESRFVSVKIESSPAIMLRGMQDSTMGIWVSHGEGRAHFKSESILNDVLEKGFAPLRYVDDNGDVTMTYPMNPNGSPSGIAALCSSNGRHLAMMPHPERCTLLWQWPWMPQEWKTSLECSPWLRMFQNAYEWCMNT